MSGSLEDIKSLCAVSRTGVAGVVVGRAIYEEIKLLRLNLSRINLRVTLNGSS